MSREYMANRIWVILQHALRIGIPREQLVVVMKELTRQIEQPF